MGPGIAKGAGQKAHPRKPVLRLRTPGQGRQIPGHKSVAEKFRALLGGGLHALRVELQTVQQGDTPGLHGPCGIHFQQAPFHKAVAKTGAHLACGHGRAEQGCGIGGLARSAARRAWQGQIKSQDKVRLGHLRGQEHAAARAQQAWHKPFVRAGRPVPLPDHDQAIGKTRQQETAGQQGIGLQIAQAGSNTVVQSLAGTMPGLSGLPGSGP